MFWRSGRAYGDFRDYEDVGGGREALAIPGSTWGTKDEVTAKTLFDNRLNELLVRRRKHAGVREEEEQSITLVELVKDHLIKKSKAERTSHSHMMDLEHRLRTALEYFGEHRDPRTIKPDHVRDWGDVLAKDGSRKPGTVRHYLNALSGLYGRAIEGLYVKPGYNPVSALVEKPTGRWKGEAAFLEVADAALLLEAARTIGKAERLMPGRDGNRVNATPGLYPIVATFLLTGGRFSEVMGLDVDDVSFDRGLVRFRPNPHRGLKTETSVRTVPLWPQLREVLQAWMYGAETPRTSGLLFPAPNGGMVRDIRKSLDAMAKLSGMEAGEIRTRRFRHTYCSTRLQTVQRILKPSREPDDPDGWEYVEVARFQVQKEMGHGGGQLVDRIYGHAQGNPQRSDVVEYRVEKHREVLGDRCRSLVALQKPQGANHDGLRFVGL